MSAMKKLSIVAIVAAVLSVGLSGVALYRTKDASSKSSTPAATAKPTAKGKGKATTTTAPGANVTVPTATGSVFIAGKAIQDLKLKIKVSQSPSASVPKGSVIAQDPAPGTKVPTGTEVKLTVSSGPP